MMRQAIAAMAAAIATYPLQRESVSTALSMKGGESSGAFSGTERETLDATSPDMAATSTYRVVDLGGLTLSEGGRRTHVSMPKSAQH
jgi:hypothetical protein